MARSGTEGLIAALASDPAGVARSPLTRWLRANHARLVEVIGDDAGRTDWTRFADLLAEHGITAQGGKRPTPDGVRKAWQRTCAAVERRRARKGRRVAPSVVQPIAEAQAAGEAPEPEEEFGFAREWKAKKEPK